ncbi:MAG TPA: G/U mismatch-specific DNA glycosylase [Coleofasciculaceae cyanobacterium]
MKKPPYKPSKAEIQAAIGKTVPDLIAPQLRVLFCGINPSLYSAVVGYHFARPGNRFWPTLYAAGFTDRLLAPAEGESLLQRGYGITNIVDRATAAATDLAPAELVAGHQTLANKVQHYRPHCLAILGIGAYRTAFKQPKAIVGRQTESLYGTLLWVLPNPSGLNAHYQLESLRQVYQELRLAVDPASLVPDNLTAES